MSTSQEKYAINRPKYGSILTGLGDSKAEVVSSQGGCGDALLRSMPPYLTWIMGNMI